MPIVAPFESAIWAGKGWRIVEAQHVASTMKLVDGRLEQDILEALLEEGKPALPDGTEGLDYLLSTPFRYPTKFQGSRFRSPTDPGVFYAAGSERTAGAELGYWRWKFLMDAPALNALEPNAHTAFEVTIKALSIDLQKAPYSANAGMWTHPVNYTATQALAVDARRGGIEAILYQSVRDPEPGWCIALLTPKAFAEPKHNPATHTWFLSVTRHEANWRRDAESMTFSTEIWNYG